MCEYSRNCNLKCCKKEKKHNKKHICIVCLICQECHNCGKKSNKYSKFDKEYHESKCECCIGPQGSIGPQGPIGPANDGPQGPIGNQGPVGNQGPIGNQGPLGSTGIQGPAGPIGNQGPIGIGIQGPTGIQGPIGPQGIPSTNRSIIKFSSGNNSNVVLNTGNGIVLGHGSYQNVPGNTTLYLLQPNNDNDVVIASQCAFTFPVNGALHELQASVNIGDLKNNTQSATVTYNFRVYIYTPTTNTGTDNAMKIFSGKGQQVSIKFNANSTPISLNSRTSSSHLLGPGPINVFAGQQAIIYVTYSSAAPPYGANFISFIASIMYSTP